MLADEEEEESGRGFRDGKSQAHKIILALELVGGRHELS
jgi:hypothetical protein